MTTADKCLHQLRLQYHLISFWTESFALSSVLEPDTWDIVNLTRKNYTAKFTQIFKPCENIARVGNSLIQNKTMK